MTIFGVSNSAKDLGIPLSRKIQAVHETLIVPVGWFQSVNFKGVQTFQRGSQDAQTLKNATLNGGLVNLKNLSRIKILEKLGSGVTV